MTVTQLQVAANWYVSRGWNITSMTDQQFSASKLKAHGLLVWVVAILFFPIGLLAFLVHRETSSMIVLADQAESQLKIAQALDAHKKLEASGRAASSF